MSAQQRLGAGYKIGDVIDYVDRFTGHRDATPIPALWYLLRVHPNRERKVERDLKKRGLAYYLPDHPCIVPIGRRGATMRTRRVDRPLFPGLIFIPDFEASLTKFRGIDGVAGFLHFGERVAFVRHRVDRKLLDAKGNELCLSMVDLVHLVAILHVPISKRAAKFKSGELVRITQGPLADRAGRIERLDDRGRIKILLDATSRSISVELNEAQIEPV